MNVAVVPAAGRSSRLGRSKALLPFGPSLVVDAVLAALVRGGADRTIVVAARGDDALAAHCLARSIDVAVNERPEAGMLSSIHSGLRAVAGELSPEDALIVLPVDYPTVRPETVAALLDALARSSIPIAVPYCGGRRGHPLVSSAALAPEIEGLDLAVGLRQLLERHRHAHTEVEDDGIHRDIDSWAHYLALTSAA